MVAQAVVRARAELIAEELQRFVDIVSRQLRPRRVILFGSAARDEISEWTDLDLVVVAETELPFYERSRLILNAVRPKVGMDVIVYTPSE